MVKGRVVSLVFFVSLLLAALVFERSVGIPVISLFLFPTFYNMLPKVERVLFFCIFVCFFAIVFAISVPVAALCSSLVLFLERMPVGRLFPSVWLVLVRAAAVLMAVVLCAFASGIMYRLTYVLYAVVVMSALVFILARIQGRLDKFHKQEVTIFS